MGSRSPARWMAPVALLAAIAAVAIVVTRTTSDGSETDEPPAASTSERDGESQGTGTSEEGGSRTSTNESRPRTYRVRPGDTLGTIADDNGLTVEELLELNPEIDPQSLNVGQRIRLSR